MAKPPIPVGCAKVEVMGNYGPATWANVLYFALATPLPTTPLDGNFLAQLAAHDLYEVAIAPRVVPAWRVTTMKVSYRDATDSLVRVTIADAIEGSASSGQEQTAQVCYLLDWVTGDPRKGGKPRTYIPGVEDSALLDTANLTSTAAANFSTAIQTWLGTLAGLSYGTASGIELVEMSFFDNKAPRSPDASFYPVHSGFCNTTVATQRRRVDRLRS